MAAVVSESGVVDPLLVGHDERIVVSLQGEDAPGICRDITAVVAAAGAEVVDMGQTVVRGRLRLVLELKLGAHTDGLLLSIVRAAKRFNLSVDFDPVSPSPMGGGEVRHVASAFGHTDSLNGNGESVGAPSSHSRSGANYVLTLLSEAGIEPLFLQRVGEALASRGCAVEKVTRMSSRSLRCLELLFSTTHVFSASDLSDLRRELYALGMESSTDVALQADTVLRRAKRIVVMDMDSTLIQQEVIDELARYAGVFDQVKEITHCAMNGELDFNQSLEKRVALLKGTHEDVFEKVIANLVYTDGAHQLCRSLKKLGYRLAVISGGFRRVAGHVARELGLDMYYANELETLDGVFTGRTVGPIVNAQRKADLLVTIAQKEGVTLDQCIAIGDGSNDLPMLGIAGLGVAFNAKPAVQRAASFRINQRNLDSALYLLGFSEDAQNVLSGESSR